jgi:hypothetical protein
VLELDPENGEHGIELVSITTPQRLAGPSRLR